MLKNIPQLHYLNHTYKPAHWSLHPQVLGPERNLLSQYTKLRTVEQGLCLPRQASVQQNKMLFQQLNVRSNRKSPRVLLG